MAKLAALALITAAGCFPEMELPPAGGPEITAQDAARWDPKPFPYPEDGRTCPAYPADRVCPDYYGQPERLSCICPRPSYWDYHPACRWECCAGESPVYDGQGRRAWCLTDR